MKQTKASMRKSVQSNLSLLSHADIDEASVAVSAVILLFIYSTYSLKLDHPTRSVHLSN